MKAQNIDNYRLTSMEEPTDEMLAQLMEGVGKAAIESRQLQLYSFLTTNGLLIVYILIQITLPKNNLVTGIHQRLF